MALDDEAIADILYDLYDKYESLAEAEIAFELNPTSEEDRQAVADALEAAEMVEDELIDLIKVGLRQSTP